jgi:hypothetical protein
MRQDKDGKFYTLEQDIERVWKQHGLKVVAEVVQDLRVVGLQGMIWTIRSWREAHDKKNRI